ncbi:MAG: hypothetical protein A2017_14000 [Lentisphaerae bacterium GWF2_44_16]|nr:MAG: hypothetical protein A2017_14000 [Lentisphaerae bacterium GWF2_44_16]
MTYFLSNPYTVYSFSLLLFSLFAGYIAFWVFRLNGKNISENEKLPRNLNIGVVLAFIDLLWCIPHSKPLLPVHLHVYLFPLVIVCTFLSRAFLDYLFSRALGGFFILLAYYFLHGSFTFHTPAASLFAVFSFAMGITGLFFAGKPYLMRDFIRKAATEKKWKHSISIFFIAFSLLSLILGILQLLRK